VRPLVVAVVGGGHCAACCLALKALTGSLCVGGGAARCLSPFIIHKVTSSSASTTRHPVPPAPWPWFCSWLLAPAFWLLALFGRTSPSVFASSFLILVINFRFQGGINTNTPLAFGARSRRRTTKTKWLSEADSAVRITPARPETAAAEGTGSSCSALTAWVVRLWKSLASSTHFF
jgi:hypothetical protein